MTSRSKRTTAIQLLAGRLALAAPTLIDDLVSDLHFDRGAAPRHVEAALAYLVTWGSRAGPSVGSDGPRRASGAVALHLHPDAPLTSFARTLPAAFLVGASQVVVNLPGHAPRLRATLARICAPLPGVVVESGPASAFLVRAFTDAFVHTVWAGGALDLLAPFEALIQETRSHVVFEGRGTDAIVVGPDADVRTSAQRSARLAFRDGGRDPAAPSRVYVPAAQHDTFVAALQACAEAFEGEPAPRPDGSGSDLRTPDDRPALELERPAARSARPRPTVVPACGPTHPAVTQRCRGPVLAVVPYADADAVLEALDQTAGPDGQVGCAVTLLGGAALRPALSRRFTYIFDADGPSGTSARSARLAWGGGPTTWTLTTGPHGLCRSHGPVDLVQAFSRASLTSRARWRAKVQAAASPE